MSEVQPGVPMGGSELILGNLRRSFPDVFPVFDDPAQDKVQIINSRPQQVVLDPERPKVLWLHDLPQDPASACLRDATYRSQFNRIVCVSHWQAQQYNAVLGIPYADLTVIKNGVPRMTATFPKERDGRIRFIYTPTPHRGLSLLAAAADALAKVRQDWVLDVYSSLSLYGWHEPDKQFNDLYDALRANPCVNYHGTRPNAEVRAAVLDAHVFVYPSVYMETSCLSIQEAMMAGCLAITTNLAALPETCAEWAWMFEVDENPEVIAQRTYNYMVQALDHYDDDFTQQTLRAQAQYFQNFWSFEARVPQWKFLLDAVLAQGAKKEMLVFE